MGHYSLATSLKFFLFTFLRTLLHFFAFFCARAKLNRFLFKRFRTLCKKTTRGGGRGVAVPFLKKNFKCLGISTDSRHSSADQMTEGSLAVTTTSALTSYSLTNENCKLTTLSVQRRNRAPLLPPPVQVVHRYVQVHAPARRLDANHQRFRLGAAAQPRFINMNFRRKHFEMKSLIVQQRHGIPDDHVRHLANRLPHYLVAHLDFRPREHARHLHRHFWRQIKNHAAFNVSLDGD